jgi:calpain-15
MSALACLAEMPHLITRRFVHGQKYQENGLYRFSFYKNGIEKMVTIDDYIPCGRDGSPIFSRAHGNEIWVMLLEKAYAKLHGSYMSLRGGFASEALYDLTGFPTTSFDISSPKV